MPETRVRGRTRNAVFERAKHRCEYCQTPVAYAIQPFVTEHIIPIARGGKSILDNLASACGGCNAFKYDKTEALDPAEGLLCPLFNPRIDVWLEHFTWDADFTRIIGLTSVGRATVGALRLNREGLVNIRRLLVLGGEHPPVQDL